MFDRPPENPQSQQNNRKRLTSDELIALFLALTTIGGLLFWFLGRKEEGWNLNVFSNTDLTTTSSLSSSANTNSNGSSKLGNQTFASETSEIAAGTPTNTAIQTNNPRNSDRSTSSLINPFNFPIITTTNKENSTDLFDNNSFFQSTPQNSNNNTNNNNPDQNGDRSGKLTFADVPNNYWAKPFIDKLAAQKTIEGFPDGNFKPDQPITRAELAAAINQAFPSNNNLNNLKFKDVIEGSDRAKAIDLSVGSGFMKGYPEGIFQPDKPVTRLQALVALATGLKIQTLQNPADVLILYQDNKNIPKWATKQIAAATDKGLVVNYPEIGLLNPDRPATRSEVAAMIYQALVISGKVPKIDSQYIVNQGK
jgi:S-layer homology domain